MKTPIILTSLLATLSMSSFAKSSITIPFESCYLERAENIPTAAEKRFLDTYLAYLKSGKKEDGENTIKIMRELAKVQGGQFSIKWVSIFEGATELCCGGPQSCTDSFGSTSLNVLMPRVEKGWVTAINLVLTYDKFAKTEGADAVGLKEYLKVIREKHPWAIKTFKK